MKLMQIHSLASLALASLVCCLSGCGKQDSSAPHGTASKTIVTLTKANFEAEVLKSSQPVLVDFWASWCGPCKTIAPTVAELAAEYEGKAKVGKVDVDAQTELAQQYGITGIPALLFFKDGKQAGQFVGVRGKAELKAKLDNLVKGGGAPAPGQ
jgi:thioredoxin 1